MKRLRYVMVSLMLGLLLTNCGGNGTACSNASNMKEILKGEIRTFDYAVATAEGTSLTKSAQVYLPYGYNAADPDKKYNVLFLAHGGGDHQGSFFDASRSPKPLDAVMDSLVTYGLAEPMIIVCPTYYKGIDDLQKDMSSTIDDCRNFHVELHEFLIPAIEKSFQVFTTRDHRAYGGFSMGALSTWYQLGYGLEDIKYFVPLSGDLWTYNEDGQKQRAEESATWLNSRVEQSGYSAHDFFVWGYTGSNDIACKPENALVGALMGNAPMFEYGVNLHYSVFEGGDHQYKYINQYLGEVIPALFK